MFLIEKLNTGSRFNCLKLTYEKHVKSEIFGINLRQCIKKLNEWEP